MHCTTESRPLVGNINGWRCFALSCIPFPLAIFVLAGSFAHVWAVVIWRDAAEIPWLDLWMNQVIGRPGNTSPQDHCHIHGSSMCEYVFSERQFWVADEGMKLIFMVNLACKALRKSCGFLLSRCDIMATSWAYSKRIVSFPRKVSLFPYLLTTWRRTPASSGRYLAINYAK